MKKRLCYIGNKDYYPIDEIDNLSFYGNNSLSDYDIIIFNSRSWKSYKYSTNESKHGLNVYKNDLKNAFDHWKLELEEANRLKKLVVIILNEFEEFYVLNGQSNYGDKTLINYVDKCNNYAYFPINLSPRNAKGKLIKLANNQDSCIRNLHSSISKYLEYKILVKSDKLTPLFYSKDGQIAGGKFDNILFLPHINFDHEDFIVEKENDKGEMESYWSDNAIKFSHSLKDKIIEISKSLNQEETPAPEWTNSKDFESEKEKELKNHLQKVQQKIVELENKRDEIKEEISKESSLKFLLYETGPTLEKAIIEALEILGFNATNFQNENMELDQLITCPEGRLIGEAEGKENKAIDITKIRQLCSNLTEDYARDDVKEIAKGILFGNPFRLDPIESRKNSFTEKCINLAKHNKIALVQTWDLFVAASYIKQSKDNNYAKQCREVIIKTNGKVVKFPNFPKNLKP